MGEAIYLDGRFLSDRAEAQVSLFDRGYLLGDAVFDTLRVWQGRPIALALHVTRFLRSAAAVGITVPEPRERLLTIAERLAAASAHPDAVLRMSVSRGEGPRGIGDVGYLHPVLAMFVEPNAPPPPDAYQKGVPTEILPTPRIPPECLDPTIKAAQYLPAILARQLLSRRGLKEGIQRALDGSLVSGLVSSLFLVEAGILKTPPLGLGAFPGITRATLLEVASRLSIPVREERLLPEQLYAASEAFFASSLIGCLPIREVDARPLATCPGPICARLSAELERRWTQEGA
ncbi:MAG: aminotransferase class IV [Myxococcota bacterium]